MKFCEYEFDGPVHDIGDLKNRAGVFLLCDDDGENLVVVDVEKTRDVRTAMEMQGRKGCWAIYVRNKPCLFVHYTPYEDEARDMTLSIRQECQPPCGAQLPSAD